MALPNASDVIFDNESVKKKTKFNVDNKLTKVMGTISFLPVFSYRIHISCTQLYVCECECDCVYRIKMAINYGKPLF